MFAGGVVVALAHGVLLRLFAAITQVFVALGGGDPFRYLNIENLFAFAILFSCCFGQFPVSQLAACLDTSPCDVSQQGY
ncbi:hypothetical protein ACIXR2_06440 [Bacteroides fragilis]